MPRNGSGIYSYPAGTEGFPDTTIESKKYNDYIADVAEDLNRPRPIVAGGTGADDADEALQNLKGEKAHQVVTNYDNHAFVSGSFESLGATGDPTGTGSLFLGHAVVNDSAAWAVLTAHDMSSSVQPGRTYIREYRSGSWGQWKIDGAGVYGPDPPVNPPDGTLWWDSEGGHLYVWYVDPDGTKQWVIASPFPDPAQFLLKAGDTMQGNLGLAANPVAPLDAASKQYVDSAIGAAFFPAGTIMIFRSGAAPPGWVRQSGENDCTLRVSGGAIGPNHLGTIGISQLAGQTQTGGFSLSAAYQGHMGVSGSFSGSGSGSVSSGGISIIGGGAGADGSAGYTYPTPTSVPFMGIGLTANVNVSGGISGTAYGASDYGAPHSHPINIDFHYIDVILATKT